MADEVDNNKGQTKTHNNCAEIFRETSFSLSQSAEDRCGNLADEFTKLEVEIATILFAFTTLFFSFFQGDKVVQFSSSHSHLVVFILKFMFITGLLLLILSLAMGLLYLKGKESFWREMFTRRLIRTENWSEVLKGDKTFEEGIAFHEGTALKKGLTIPAPRWPWILQTICLGLAIILLFTLFVVLLF